MKKSIILGSLALILSTFTAPAQQNVPRVDAARAAVDQTREFRGDDQSRADRQFGRERARAQYEIDRLNGEVRDLRIDVSKWRSSHIRSRFENLQRDADRLTALFRQDRIRSWDARQRAIELRRDASHLRTMLHMGWR